MYVVAPGVEEGRLRAFTPSGWAVGEEGNLTETGIKVSSCLHIVY